MQAIARASARSSNNAVTLRATSLLEVRQRRQGYLEHLDKMSGLIKYS